MINAAQNQTAGAEDICLRHELSHTTKTEAVPPQAGNWNETGIIHWTRAELLDRAQWKAAQRIEASVSFMMQHLHQPIRISTLSAMVGLSESSFFAHFKGVTGRTPLDFLIRARMQRAGELLAGTRLQIKKVAAMLGYDDPFYFSRLFKSVHGISPRDYRFQQAESEGQKLKPRPVGELAPAVSVTPALPRLVQAGESRMTETFVVGQFQSAAPRAQILPARCRNSASPREQACSNSVHP